MTPFTFRPGVGCCASGGFRSNDTGRRTRAGLNVAFSPLDSSGDGKPFVPGPALALLCLVLHLVMGPIPFRWFRDQL